MQLTWEKIYPFYPNISSHLAPCNGTGLIATKVTTLNDMAKYFPNNFPKLQQTRSKTSS